MRSADLLRANRKRLIPFMVSGLIPERQQLVRRFLKWIQHAAIEDTHKECITGIGGKVQKGEKNF